MAKRAKRRGGATGQVPPKRRPRRGVKRGQPKPEKSRVAKTRQLNGPKKLSAKEALVLPPTMWRVCEQIYGYGLYSRWPMSLEEEHVFDQVCRRRISRPIVLNPDAQALFRKWSRRAKASHDAPERVAAHYMLEWLKQRKKPVGLGRPFLKSVRKLLANEKLSTDDTIPAQARETCPSRSEPPPAPLPPDPETEELDHPPPASTAATLTPKLDRVRLHGEACRLCGHIRRYAASCPMGLPKSENGILGTICDPPWTGRKLKRGSQQVLLKWSVLAADSEEPLPRTVGQYIAAWLKDGKEPVGFSFDRVVPMAPPVSKPPAPIASATHQQQPPHRQDVQSHRAVRRRKRRRKYPGNWNLSSDLAIARSRTIPSSRLGRGRVLPAQGQSKRIGSHSSGRHR